MAEAYLVDAVRTPVGRRGGGLAGAHPADLGAHVIRALLARTGADPLAVDDVVFGCVDTLGPQAGDIARTAWLAAGLPEAVPGVTVDRQCGSSQQAVHFAAQAVLSGTADLVVAGGVQNMSMIPIAAAMAAGQAFGFDDPFGGSEGWRARYGDQEISQFRAADMIAAKWTACWDEPHCRSTVTPGTASGRPAASHAVRAMSPAWGPTVSTQPNTTSSTASGSAPVRASSAAMTCAPRSAGCTPARPPPRRPTGVRTASTRNASATVPPLRPRGRTPPAAPARLHWLEHVLF